MATYGISSASKELTTTSGNDTITMVGVGTTQLSAQTINGGSGNDVIDFAAFGRTAMATGVVAAGSSGNQSGTVSLGVSAFYSKTFSGASAAVTAIITGVITSQAMATTASKLIARGQEGNDTIIFGSKLKSLTASYVGAGKGNDYVLFGGSFVNNVFATGATDDFSGASAVATTIYGGEGRDTIDIRGGGLLTAVEINGHTDNDEIKFVSGNASNTYVGGGKGNDSISGSFIKFDTSSIVGGLGADTLNLKDINSGNAALIAGDQSTRGGTDGGNDSIYISGAIMTSTIIGGAGNDSITLELLESSGNTVYGDAGNDVVSAGGVDVVDITDTNIYLGKGDDKFNMNDLTGSKLMSGVIVGGQGADTVAFNGTITATEVANVTVNGGAGADYLLADATIVNGGTADVVIEFTTASDSTISAFDTIVAKGSASATYEFNYVPGGAARGTFSGNGVTATDGIVVFSGSFDSSVTARAESISSNAAATGNVFGFEDGSGISYLFIKGSSENIVAQVASAAYSGGVHTLSVSDGKQIKFTID